MPRSARLPVRACFPPAQPLGEPGAPGVIRQGGIFQRLWGDRVVLVGGPAAILLQVAHPLVAAGIAAHSDYRQGPGHRLLATLDATLTISFGDAQQARAAAAEVGRRHVPVRGVLDQLARSYAAGTSYAATDPDLALWVYATLVHTAYRVHQRYGVRIDAGQREAYLTESMPFAQLFGVPPESIPPTWREFSHYLQRTADETLDVTAAAREVGVDMMRPRLVPPAPGTGVLLRAVSADLLPPRVRDGYALPWNRQQQLQVKAFSRLMRGLWPRAPRPLRQFPHVARAEQRLTHSRE